MAKPPQAHYPNPERTSALPEGGLPLRELLAILRRRRRVIFWVTAMVTTVAILIGLQVTKTYTAAAQVMIEPRESRIVNAEKVAPGLPAEDSAIIETHIKLIQSRATLARAVDNLKLLSERTSVPGRTARDDSVGGPVALLAGWLPEWMAEQLSGRWAVAAGLTSDGAPGPDVLREQAIDALQGDLKVVQAGRSYVLSISYTSTRPQEAVRIANGIAAAYVDVQLDEKLSATRRASAWLGEQVEQLRWRVFGSELAIEEFRAAHGLVDTARAPLDSQQLGIITNSLINARAERSAKEARLQSLREMRDGGHGLESSAEVLSSPLMLSLRAREMDLLREEAQLAREYGEHHPRILQLRAEQEKLTDRIDHEIDNVIANLENEVALARSRERAHAEHLREVKGQSALSGQAEVQLRELEREAAASRSLYETLLIRLKETEQQQEIVQADARLISPARVPEAPSSPSPKLFAMVGFTASLVFGSILALLLEQLDDTLRTGRQVEELLGVPSLGLVPKVAGAAADTRLHGHMVDRPQSAYAEAVHALHTQVCLAAADRPPPSAILRQTHLRRRPVSNGSPSRTRRLRLRCDSRLATRAGAGQSGGMLFVRILRIIDGAIRRGESWYAAWEAIKTELKENWPEAVPYLVSGLLAMWSWLIVALPFAIVVGLVAFAAIYAVSVMRDLRQSRPALHCPDLVSAPVLAGAEHAIAEIKTHLDVIDRLLDP